MSDLRPDEFAEFFRLVNDRPPFVWQNRLAQEVFARGWPVALDVPTGAGKTAVIDIAVFHLALEAHRRVERRAPVRILFVVDRRLIVDAAHERALKITKELKEAKDGILERVAARLKLFAEEGGPPLRVAKLRGGAPKDPDWVRTPTQPTVVVSTVDQVGSRLLFRGYGVSNAMKPIHAGLLGVDALLLLDEAHLSQPFVQTAIDSRMFQSAGAWSEDKAAAPFAIVTLSATLAPADAKGEPFCLNDEERAEELVAKRLAVSKPATLVDVSAKDLPDTLADRAWALSKASKDDAREGKAGGGKATVVAVVVNRVARARDVFKALQKKGARPLAMPGAGTEVAAAPPDESKADCALLIGRTRELERRELTGLLLERMKAQRKRSDTDVPLFVVATQTIEAGADLDFDALVTEVAPLDCLRQRFGRLDRLGEYGEARAVIVAESDQVAKNAKDDPIYGGALKTTWTLLTEKSGTGRPKKKKVKGKGREDAAPESGPTIDLGIEAGEAWFPSGDALAACLAPRADAPVLLPRDISFWTRTSPPPAVDPQVSLYLHGPGGSGDVEIVWRADLDDDMGKQDWIDRVAVCPPSALEAVSVPIGEAKRWLRGDAKAEIADVELSIDDDEDRRNQERRTAARKALRWRGVGNDGTEWVSAEKLAPGDVIVVPSAYGGCDRWGWAPQSKEPVPDLGRAANLEHRDRSILRITRASPELGLGGDGEDALAEQLSDLRDTEIIAEYEKYLRTADEAVAGRSAKHVRVLRDREGRPLALERKLTKRELATRDIPGGDATTEDDDSPRSTTSVPLNPHCAGVAERARGYAEALGLAATLVSDIELAGLLHDAGKAHPAFQRLLYGGSELAAAGGALLAKSGRLPSSAAAWRAACRRAGLPQGARHEIASLAVAEAHPAFAQASDPDLVLWLIGTHHGFGRPFFPTAFSAGSGESVDWPASGDEAITVDLAGAKLAVERFRSLAQFTGAWIDLSARVQRRYGPWGLARLEAILRLADHRESERHDEAGDEGEEAPSPSPAEAAE